MCIPISCGSQRQLVNCEGGLIPVVVHPHHPPPYPLLEPHTHTHSYIKLFHWCCWQHCEGLLAFINVSFLLHSHSPAHTHTPTRARVHIWRGRKQVMTPRWPQSGRCRFLFALFFSFSLSVVEFLFPSADFIFYLSSNRYAVFFFYGGYQCFAAVSCA